MERGERYTVRDVATLWYLFVEVNARFLVEKRALWLQLAYLASTHGRWISDIERGGEVLREHLEGGAGRDVRLDGGGRQADGALLPGRMPVPMSRSARLSGT
jgi:hypothetical protein